jgi:hypothetical protein
VSFSSVILAISDGTRRERPPRQSSSNTREFLPGSAPFEPVRLPSTCPLGCLSRVCVRNLLRFQFPRGDFGGISQFDVVAVTASHL